MAVNDDINLLKELICPIEANYRGLGIPITYGILSILANKSVFFIGGRGVGKTRVIKSIPEFPDHNETTFDSFTYDELDHLCHSLEPANNMLTEDPQIGARNEKLVFKVPEFSTLSQYHREIFLTVCSRIASDGEYIHQTTTLQHLKFENCKLSMIVAVQPRLYSQLCNRYQQWETMSSDRFTKFALLNPLRQGNTIDEPFVATLPREIPPTATIPQDISIDELSTLFGEQISEGRKRLYARDYAIAFTRLLGKNEVVQTDVDLFYKLFSPYLQSFSNLQERANLEATVTVSSGNIELLVEIAKYMDGITSIDLAANLMVTVRHIQRGLDFLLDKDLIREQEHRYYLNQELLDFFNWYRDTFSLTNVAGD